MLNLNGIIQGPGAGGGLSMILISQAQFRDYGQASLPGTGIPEATGATALFRVARPI